MWKINTTTDWESLQRFSWIQDMHGVPQDAIHHAEGDVAIHTQMVLKALEALPEYQELDAYRQTLVWTAALLHDVEKRSTTQEDENGRIISPGHAKKGAQTTRVILYREVPCPFEMREQIVGLVRYHGLPLWIFEKQDPQRYLLKTSLEADTELLCMLAKADVLGRICSDAENLLYRIELFRELCRENNCYGQPPAFANDLAQFEYFRKEDRTPDYEPFDDRKGEVVLLSGIAGSGKDHYLKRHFPDHAVISLDDLRRKNGIQHNDSEGNGRIIQQAKEQARVYLRKGQPFVWNATNITQQMRSQLIDLFAVYNPVIRIVYLEVPYEQLVRQNRDREYVIPQQAIEKMVMKLEVPKVWEAHVVEYVVKQQPK